MSTFTVLLLCIQACLVQNVFSRVCGAYGPAIAPAIASPILPGPCGLKAPGLAFDALTIPAVGLAYDGLAIPAPGFPAAYPALGLAAEIAPYGGAGEGNVAVIGELPVAGTTAVAGQVPIMGAVISMSASSVEEDSFTLGAAQSHRCSEAGTGEKV